MFDMLSDNFVKRAAHRICGMPRLVPVRSGQRTPRLASRETRSTRRAIARM